MQCELGIDIQPVGSIKEAVHDADIVICATSSQSPIIKACDLKPGAHVNTVGPKTILGHEVGGDIAARAGIIATDSKEQTRAYAAPFFLNGSGHEERMVELSDLMVGRVRGRMSEQEISLFCSVGLAGTGVAVAAALLDQHKLASF